MKNAKHYTKDGKLHKGATHKMPNGHLHSGVKHTKNSKRLYHFKELSKTVQAKVNRKQK